MTDTRTPDLLDLLRHTDSYEWPDLPEGHVYGWRSIRPDHHSRDGFRWPWPGQEAVAPDDGRDLSPDTAPGDPCPSAELGGLCLAKTWVGARSGGVPATTNLLVAYRPVDVLGENADKLRVARCVVLDVIDLTGANLARANLARADLGGADLGGANLGGANLYEANLARANLTRANLARAYLARADLYGADLYGAYLTGANLRGAYLRGANLGGAYLAGAYLAGAYLAGAYLYRADLRGANRRSDDPPVPGWTRTDTGALAREADQ